VKKGEATLQRLCPQLFTHAAQFPQWNRKDFKFEGVSPEMGDLLSQLLEVEPGMRLTAEGALKHPLFENFNFH
jgi:serine/threonine protein kinase